MTDPRVRDGALSPSALADVPGIAAVSTAELLQLLEASPDPLFLVDRNWRLRYLNAAAAGLWRVDAAEAVGRPLWSVQPALVGGTLHERLGVAMRERRAMHAQVRYEPLDAWIGASAFPAEDGLLVIEHLSTEPEPGDTTDLLVAERAARQEAERQREGAQRLAAELRTAREAADGVRRAAERARGEAEAAMRAKSDFLATMSHELRTPINAITGYTQLLELGVAGPVTDMQRGYLGRLYASGRHLLGLVDDVLDLSNIERGRMSIAPETLTTGPVVAAALALVTPDAAARSIRLIDQGEGDNGLSFVGDEHRVRQILLNLLSNAVKFTAPGGTVAVGCERIPARRGSAPTVEITVRDTGIGIESSQQGAIFEPFMQADSSRTRTAGGTGLGLALSRRLARLMDGDLTVDSKFGEGSTFILTLPAAAASPKHEEATVAVKADDAAVVALEPADSSDAVEGTVDCPLEIGVRLREQLEPLIDGFVTRLRSDGALGAARTLSRTQLENHSLSMLAALLQSLVIVEEDGGLEGDLLRDAAAIQEHIGFRHGEQRFRLGWTEGMIDREYEILGDEVTSRLRPLLPPGHASTDRMLDVVTRLLERAHEVSLRGFQHARRFAHL